MRILLSILCDVQVHLLRVEPLRGFLEPASVGSILRLKRSLILDVFHLSLIHLIINAYSNVNHFH
jgi:hypothetical protein